MLLGRHLALVPFPNYLLRQRTQTFPLDTPQSIKHVWMLGVQHSISIIIPMGVCLEGFRNDPKPYGSSIVSPVDAINKSISLIKLEISDHVLLLPRFWKQKHVHHREHILPKADTKILIPNRSTNQILKIILSIRGLLAQVQRFCFDCFYLNSTPNNKHSLILSEHNTECQVAGQAIIQANKICTCRSSNIEQVACCQRREMPVSAKKKTCRGIHVKKPWTAVLNKFFGLRCYPGECGVVFFIWPHVESSDQISLMPGKGQHLNRSSILCFDLNATITS